jgi:hypothetical protein
MEDEGRLAERAGDREDKHLPTITKAKKIVEKAGDQEMGTKLDQIYELIENKINKVAEERRGNRTSIT